MDQLQEICLDFAEGSFHVRILFDFHDGWWEGMKRSDGLFSFHDKCFSRTEVIAKDAWSRLTDENQFRKDAKGDCLHICQGGRQCPSTATSPQSGIFHRGVWPIFLRAPCDDFWKLWYNSITKQSSRKFISPDPEYAPLTSNCDKMIQQENWFSGYLDCIQDPNDSEKHQLIRWIVGYVVLLNGHQII